MNYNRTYHAAYRREHAGTISRYQAAYYSLGKEMYGKRQQWLACARLALGWSQAGLADAVGVSQATIARLETGALPLETFRKRDKLLKVLEVVV